MKKLLLIVASSLLFSAPSFSANAVTGYVQVNPPNAPQPGGFNTQSGTVGTFTDNGAATFGGNALFTGSGLFQGPVQFYQNVGFSKLGLVNGQCLGLDGSGNIVTYICGGNSGSIGSGTALGIYQNGVLVTSPTFALNYLAPPFKVSAVSGGTTSQFILDPSSVTLYGPNIPATVISAGSLGASVLASSVAAGSVGVVQLNFTGAPSATTFARGDGSWATVSSGGGGSGAGIYPATGTASFPFGATFSTAVISQLQVTSNTILAGTTFYNDGTVFSSLPNINSSVTGIVGVTSGGKIGSAFSMANPILPVYGGTGIGTPPTNGSLLIGETSGNQYVSGNLTGTSGNIAVTNGPGTIALNTGANVPLLAANQSWSGTNTFGNTVVSGSFATNGSATMQTPVSINQPSAGVNTSEVDFTNVLSNSSSFIKQQWYAGTGFDYPLSVETQFNTDLTKFSGIAFDPAFGTSIIYSTNSAIAFQAAGVSISSNGALSMSSSGNLSFTKSNGDANSYQIVGTSVAPTIGQCAVFSSSDTVQGQSCGAGGSFINNGATVQVAQFNITSGTFSGTIVDLSTNIPPNYYSAIENPLAYFSNQSAIGLTPGSQSEAIFAEYLDTGAVTNALNDGLGIHARARQFQGSNGQMIGGLFDTQAQGANGPPSIAVQAVPGWVSDLPGGTNELVEGVVINPRIATITGGTPLSTGTAIGVRIPDFSNGKGAPGQNWPLYIDNPYPSFFNGPISIGQTNPTANFTVAASTTQGYVMILGTVPFNTFNAPMPSSAWVMSVTTNGIVNSHGIHNFLNTVNITTNAVIGSATYYQDGTIVGAKLTQSMPALTGDITSSAGSVATTAAAAQANITSLTTSAAFSIPNSTVTIAGARAYLAVSDGLTGGGGLNLQGTAVTGTGFSPGLLGNNLIWNDGISLWSVANNFGTNFDGIIFRPGGDIAFASSNQQAVNTTLSDATLQTKFHFYQTANLGLTGINMGSTVPSLAQFQVTGTTTTTLAMAVSTSTVGPFFVDVSTMGILGFQDQQSSPTLSGCGTGPSIIGNNQNMEITGGTGSTGCTVTFTPGTYKLRPICRATPETGSITNSFTFSWTASAVTIAETGLGTGKTVVECTGRD